MKNTLFAGGMFAAFLLLLAIPPGCYYDNEEELYGGCDTTGVTYNNFVRQLLESQCTPSCHSGTFPSGGYDFTQYAVIKSVALNNNLLYNSITRTDNRMPQGGSKLEDCTILKIDAWIKAGAPEN